MAKALDACGWEFDALGLMYPRVYANAYRSITADPYLDAASISRLAEEHPAQVLVVCNEPNWPLAAFRAGACGRPVVLDVADLQSQRADGYIDPYEAEALSLADAFIFVTEDQHAWSVEQGLVDAAKPYALLSNQTLAAEMIDSTPLPHIGGMVYQGGMNLRGEKGGWRDLSSLADALDGQLHLYGDKVDYGIWHDFEMEYRLLIHWLARHDWGFVGSPIPTVAWDKTLPNKIYDYFAAGLPVVVMNAGQCRPFCDEGMGIWCESVEEAAEVVRSVDPASYRETVRARRGEYTMDAHVAPLARILGELAEASS